MIKFVCASCGERLSVPDQHGGRKGLCPSCGAINRIPLKGSAETTPRPPAIAPPVEKPAELPVPQAVAAPAAPDPIARGVLSIPALSGRADDSEPHEQQSPPAIAASAVPVMETPAASESPTDVPADDNHLTVMPDPTEDEPLMVDPVPPTPVVASAGAASLGIFGTPTPPSPPASPKDDQTPIWTPSLALREASQRMADYQPDAPPARERKLPRPVKLFLLILAVLAVVGGLYCVLYFGIQAVMGRVGGGSS